MLQSERIHWQAWEREDESVPKSKHARALFEVIGKDPKYGNGGEAFRLKNNGGRRASGTGAGPAPVQAAGRPSPLAGWKRRRSNQPATQPPAHKPQDPARLQTATKPKFWIFKIAKGRVSLSLNAANSMIAAGCLFLVAFALFVIGYRSGTGQTSLDAGQTSAGIDRIADARNQPARPAVVQLGMAKPKPAPGPSKARRPADHLGPPLKLIRRGQETAPKHPPSTKEIEVIGLAGATDPRVSGLTYIVIEYFPKSDRNDALAECRHAGRFLKSNGIDTFILAGKEGYQLLTRKGFRYKTEKQACLDYKAEIRKLAKVYKPLDRGYRFASFVATYYPGR